MAKQFGGIARIFSKKGTKGKVIFYGVILVLFAFLPLYITKYYSRNVASYILIYMLAATSLRLITVSGDLSFAHGAFMGFGAYVAGVMSKWLSVPWFITIPIGGVCSLIIAVITAYPFTRLRKTYYTMCSMFLATAILLLVSVLRKWTGGNTGLSGIKGLTTNRVVNYYIVFVTVSVCMGIMYRIEHSQIGRDFMAIAQSHQVASSIGINERLYRIIGIGLGCFFAGIAGGLYAHYSTVITVELFELNGTLWLFLYVIVGGADDFAGPIIGAIVLRLIPELVRNLGIYADYVSVAALILVVYAFPKGIVSIKVIVERIRDKQWGKNSSAPPEAN